MSLMDDVKKWSLWELELDGPKSGNPYLDVDLNASFNHKNRTIKTEGFYDGECKYKIRFMPDRVGEWSYHIESSEDSLDGLNGKFECKQPEAGIHGPVRVDGSDGFVHANGKAFYPIGTTSYAWIHQKQELQEETLKTLEGSPFNKVRMTIFFNYYVFNRNKPLFHPFKKNNSEERDFTKPNYEFFNHLDRRVMDLMELGIQADLILFHPYDRWGYADMGRDADERYLSYIVARLASYRNVWWSLANEYDLMEEKSILDWDHYFKIVQEDDPYQHPRSIHNCREFYNHSKPWVTHMSIQANGLIDRKNGEGLVDNKIGNIQKWKENYGKVAVIDECGYEGNNGFDWGSLTPKELVRRLWEITCRGGYPAAHGETYLHSEDVLWWAKGGKLHGKSSPRIKFLKEILEEIPESEMKALDKAKACIGKEGEFYLMYFGALQPAVKRIDLPSNGEFKAEIVDTWKMKTKKLNKKFQGKTKIELPGKPYIALKVKKIPNST